MKFAVGYPIAPDEETLDLFVTAIEKHRDAIDEIYFALPGDVSGRAPGRSSEHTADVLSYLAGRGLRMDLLFNGNCYGHEAVSKSLAEHVCRQIDSARKDFGVGIITTTSPFIADVVGHRFPDLERRASVNMRIGTIHGLEMMADLFESFYLQRDYNRDVVRLQEAKAWANKNGKRLCMLANSGCLAFCSGQTFHDNLVAHERELSSSAGGGDDFLACRRLLRQKENWPAVLSATWIRPEDVVHYEMHADTMKLATRMHQAPHRVIEAYASARHRGNLLDLLEPGHGDLLQNSWLDNRAFPSDWFERTSSCSRNCEACGYCRSVLETIAT